MADKDFSVGVTNYVPNPGNMQSSKPSYLVYLHTSKYQPQKYFLALDKIDHFPSHLNVKGFFPEESTQENIIENYKSIISSVSKDKIVELMIPWNEVYMVRSLVFSAVKNTQNSSK